MVEREVARIEREVAFMRGQFSLAFPTVTQSPPRTVVRSRLSKARRACRNHRIKSCGTPSG